MKGHASRLAAGGMIDRSKAMGFTFNGKNYSGFQGDTLASALLANGVTLTARSLRYHRPRGIFSAGEEECHAIVCVGEGVSREPNVRATQQLLFEGLVANSQNGWPSIRFDLGAIVGWLSRCLPVGFYYKTFKWPRWSWYETAIRRLAGVAPAPEGTDSDAYEKRHEHCDLLIIGAGPSGLSAAISAASKGIRLIMADSQPLPGGSLLWNQQKVDGHTGIEWAQSIREKLQAMPNVKILERTTVVAAWDHGYFTAVQQTQPGEHVTQRLLKIRAKHSILASGAIERPLIFPDNDRPGIMLAAAARQYIHRYAVLPGKRAVVFTNNDSAYATATALHRAGSRVAAVVDIRQQVNESVLQPVQSLGITVYAGYEIIRTRGYLNIRSITIRPRQGNASNRRDTPILNCDLLCVSGGWSPALHLYSQSGGQLQYSDSLVSFVPAADSARTDNSLQPAGSAAGLFDLESCLQSGRQTAELVLSKLGISQSRSGGQDEARTYQGANGISEYWHTPEPSAGRQWVDQLHDVTSDSIRVAVNEGFSSVEHLKRYTTIGMAMDQGKTSNVNALGILGELTGQSKGTRGTTTFRPPYVPVSIGVLAGRETGRRAWPMRRLPLHDWHRATGGLMEDHSGWLRPACYALPGESETQAIRREVLATRQSVSLFDSSSLGKIEVRGPDARQFLNRMYINNVETLAAGKIRYGMMLNENGIIIDDGVLACLGQDSYLVSCSSAGTAKVLLGFEEWLQTEWPDLDVLVHNATTQWATLMVSGPNSRRVVSKLLPEADLSANSFPHMSVLEGVRDSLPFRLMRVSFTGEMSYELSVPADSAVEVWNELLAAGSEFHIMPIGMEALEVLRMEKGFLEVGVDTDVSTNPLDVGWALPIARKSADFIGKRSLIRPGQTQADRLQLVGLKPVDPRQLIPAGSHIISPMDSSPEGHVTSGCISPTLDCSIAMALLKAGHSRLGQRVTVDVNKELVPTAVVSLAFYDPEGTRLHA